MYTPVSLPKLPRAVCPFQHFIIGKNSVQAGKCSAPALASGFCSSHEYVLDFLQAGAALGYPEVVISDLRTIERGPEQWEQAALRLWTAFPVMRSGKTVYLNYFDQVMRVLYETEFAQNETALALFKQYRNAFRDTTEAINKKIA